ncbi:MAG: BRO family protein [Candidatus Ventricola sp.]|nr:BRO family protein [Candidatus Ventricola sp.]
MNDLQVFENPAFGQVRTVTKDGEPWFVAADVCRALEVDPTATRRLDDDEKNTLRLTQGTSGNPNVTIVNEPGLYSLVLGSRKPEAKNFKRWITHEVIPSIRKTGSYSIQEPETPAQLRAKAMMINAKTRLFNAAMKAVDRFQMSPVALEALGIPMIEEFTGVKTGYRPRIETTYSATELGEEFGVSANRIGRIAKDNGLKTDEYGITVLDKSRSSDKLVPCFRYNAKGRERLAELLKGGERNG